MTRGVPTALAVAARPTERNGADDPVTTRGVASSSMPVVETRDSPRGWLGT